VSGKLEVDGASYHDSESFFYGGISLDNFQKIKWFYTTYDLLTINADYPHHQAGMMLGYQGGRQLVLGNYDVADKDYDHGTQSHPTLFIHSSLDPDLDNSQWLGLSHNGTDACYTRGTGVHKFDAPIRTSASEWYYCKYIDAMNLSSGGSGATQVTPDANTIGGYQLDAATEYLYFNGIVRSNWDGASDLKVDVVFEVNVDNTAGADTDTVDLALLTYYKGDGETSNKTQTVEVATTVGQSARYKQFTATFTIDWDLTDNVVQVGDIFAFRLNLETDTSEVDNVIINFVRFYYQTKMPQPEI